MRFRVFGWSQLRYLGSGGISDGFLVVSKALQRNFMMFQSISGAFLGVPEGFRGIS